MSPGDQEPLFLGVDFGTSGVRGSVINQTGDELAHHAIALTPAPVAQGHSEEARPQRWREALAELLAALGEQIELSQIVAIAIDGTSSTVLLCDASGEALTPALMYNDSRAREQAARIAEYAPANSGAHGASSSLAKYLYLKENYPDTRQALACHQADYVQCWLSGRASISDENNCLKLGYDSLAQHWPEWIRACGVAIESLPKVTAPGTVIAPLLPERARTFGLSEDCLIVSGTTDSIAALIASGASEIGDAVTALGSTLVLKLISSTPLFAAEYGIYSHKLGPHWLVGGASNSGGRVLREYFTQTQLDTMTPLLKPEQPTGLHYYPLIGHGERFPICDPARAPQLTPRPDDDVVYFQGMLEGIADIEAEGYALLQRMGAATAKRIFSSGGGANNLAWCKIRAQKLGLSMVSAKHSEASIGAAYLARQGWHTRG